MEFITDILTNPSIKRSVVGGITAAIIALNKKLGLQLELGDITALVTLAVAFIGQSAIKEVKLAGVEAAAKVDSVKAAVDVLNATPQTTTVNVESK